MRNWRLRIDLESADGLRGERCLERTVAIGTGNVQDNFYWFRCRIGPNGQRKLRYDRDLLHGSMEIEVVREKGKTA